MAGSGGPETQEADRADRLKALVGKRVLVGITYLDAGGDIVEQEQISGLIVDASARGGVEVERDENAGPFNLPPVPDNFFPAPEGRYRLRASGRFVVDPDLLSTWDFHLPANG